MKTQFLISALAFFAFACNNSGTDVTTRYETDTTDNAAKSTPMHQHSEGDVTYRNGSVLVWKNGDWEATNDDVRLNDGAVVHSNGHVEKDNDVVVLDDGEVVDDSGNFFDEAGHALNKGWNEAKKGVKKAGEGVEKGANKVGEEVKDVFDGKDKNDND
jgi:hypothetical protein